MKGILQSHGSIINSSHFIHVSTLATLQKKGVERARWKVLLGLRLNPLYLPLRTHPLAARLVFALQYNDRGRMVCWRLTLGCVVWWMWVSERGAEGSCLPVLVMAACIWDQACMWFWRAEMKSVCWCCGWTHREGAKMYSFISVINEEGYLVYESPYSVAWLSLVPMQLDSRF